MSGQHCISLCGSHRRRLYQKYRHSVYYQSWKTCGAPSKFQTLTVNPIIVAYTGVMLSMYTTLGGGLGLSEVATRDCKCRPRSTDSSASTPKPALQELYFTLSQ